MIMCNILLMITISVPIGKGRTDLCQLIKQVESGKRVILTAYGKPKAVLSPRLVCPPFDPTVDPLALRSKNLMT